MSETDGLSSLIEKEGKNISNNDSTETTMKVKKSVSVEKTMINKDNPLAVSNSDFEGESSVVRVTGEGKKMEIIRDAPLGEVAAGTTTKVTKVTTVETTTEEATLDNPLEKFLPEDKRKNIVQKPIKKNLVKKKVVNKDIATSKLTAKKKVVKKVVKKKVIKKKAVKKKSSKKKAVKKKTPKKRTAKKKTIKKKLAKTVRKSAVISSKEGVALERSMLVLAKQINTFADIFSIATKELKKDVEGEMIDKLDKILHENSIIAEAILTLLEEMKEDNRINRKVIKKHIDHQEALQPFSSGFQPEPQEQPIDGNRQNLMNNMKTIADDRNKPQPVTNNIQQVQATSTTNVNIQNNEIKDIRRDRLDLTHRNIRDIFSENPYYKKRNSTVELKGIPKINELPPGIDEEESSDVKEN